MDDTDLRGMDLASAKEYIFAYALDQKRLEKDIEAARAEAETWKGRVALAEGKGLADLAAAAKAKATELETKIGGLEGERAELRAKVARMREQLPMIAASERSIDPDRLLAELQLMTGELLGPAELGAEGAVSAATEREFAKLESSSKAETDLEALKKKAAGGP